MSQSSEQGASIWITGARVIKIRAEEGNNVREDAMAEQIRLSLVLSASFHFIIEHHMMGKQRQTLTIRVSNIGGKSCSPDSRCILV